MKTSARAWSQRAWLIAAALIATWFSAAMAIAATYVYDANGRMVAAKNDAGEVARYRYDDLGNLVGIDRLATNQLALFEFAPGRGATGSNVTLKGHGFSTTPASNTVRFSGTTATVVSSSASEIVATVPATATSGPISVTVSGSTATSTNSFIVDANARQPQIDSVSPLLVAQGDNITVGGQHMEPEEGASILRLGGQVVGPSTMTPTSAVFAAPAKAIVGKVSVSTIYGTASSANDVLVVPSGLAVTDISQVIRLTPDAAATSMATTGANNRVAVLFDASAGQMLSMQFSAMSTSNLSVELYRADGMLMDTWSVYNTRLTYHLPKLPVGGTHFALIRNSSSAASWQMAIENDKRFTADQSTFSVSTAIAYQTKRLVYNATEGGSFGMRVSNIANDLQVDLESIEESDYSSAGCSAGFGCELDGKANVSGTYTLTLKSSGSGTLSASAMLLMDQQATLQVGNTHALSLSPAGRNGRFRFQANAGAPYSIQITGQQTTPAGQDVYYSLYAPDGSFVKSVLVSGAGNGTIAVTSLPSTGTYSLLVDPAYDAAVTATLTLVPGISSPIAVDGAPVNISTTAGQVVRMPFSISATSHLGVGISGLTTPGTSDGGLLSVLNSSGTEIRSTSCEALFGGCDLDLANLSAGDYSIVLTPPPTGNGTMSFTATVSTDLIVPLSRSTPTAISVNRFGQNVRLQFDAAQSEWLVVGFLSPTTTPAGQLMEYAPVDQNGDVSSISRSAEPYAAIHFSNLSQTRTYQSFVSTEHGGTFSINARLELNTPHTLTVGGGSVTYSNVVPGAATYVRFTATQGANFGIGFTQISAPGTQPPYAPRLTVREPTFGGQAISQECSLNVSGCEYELGNATAGTYTAEILPTYSGNGTISFDLAVSPDVVMTVPAATPIAMSLPHRGQNARLTFAGTSGRNYSFVIQNASTVPASKPVFYTFYRPNGSFFTSFSATGNTSNALPVLSVSGNYTVFVDPTEAASYSATVTVAEPLSGTLTVDSAPQFFDSTLAGASVYLSFSANQGANLGLAITGLTTPGSTSSITPTVYGPSNNFITSMSCSATVDGCEADMTNLAAGTYRIEVPAPSDGNRLVSFTATLSSDATGNLLRSQSNAVSITRRGQNGRYTFSGTAGEIIAIDISGQTTGPADTSATHTVYRPDGTQIASSSITASGSLNLGALPSTGTYTLLIDPSNGATLNSNIAFSTSTPLTIGGVAVPFLGSVGASAYYSFTATAGQNLGIGISNLTTPGSTAAATVSVKRSDGTTLATQNCLASNNGCDLDLANMTAGTYSIVVSPPSGASMGFDILISADATSTLALDVPSTVSVSRRGQNARATFSGTSGTTRTVRVATQTTVPAGQVVNYTVYRPNGTVHVTGTATSATTLSLGSLPTTGTYTVWMDPQNGETFSAQVTLESTPASITNNGSSVTRSTTVAGQIVQLTFTATAGQNLGLGLSALTTTGTTNPIVMEVYRPDNSLLGTVNCLASNSGCQINLPALTAGAHRIRVVPPTAGNRTMSLTATLSSDATGTLNLNTATSININRRGKNARYTFSGTAGQNFKLVISSQTTSPTGRRVFYTVLNSNGTTLASSSSTTATLTFDVPTLPTTGTYTVLVDPEFGETATMTVNRQTR